MIIRNLLYIFVSVYTCYLLQQFDRFYVSVESMKLTSANNSSFLTAKHGKHYNEKQVFTTYKLFYMNEP